MIDFKEIKVRTENNKSYTDDFELFARDFFKSTGFEIISEPSRGIDGGMDLKIKEIKYNYETKKHEDFYWLVSCKHFAHSDNSVGITIEQNIRDRVDQFSCDGFIGFYSTIISSSLKARLESYQNQFLIKIYDKNKIANEILGFGKMDSIFCSYFPESYKLFRDTYFYSEPVKLFDFFFNKRNEFGELDFLITFFKSTDNVLKALRNSDDLNTFFEYQGINLLIDDDIIELYHQSLSNTSYNTGESHSRLRNEIIPNKIHQKYTLNFVPKLLIESKIYFSLISYEEEVGYSLIYPNLYLMNSEQELYLDKLYKELKEIIT
jgi:hypothetical protein